MNSLVSKNVDKDWVLKKVSETLPIWNRMATQLLRLLITLGVTGVLGSLFITAFAGEAWFGHLGIKIVSFISTLSLTLLTAFGIVDKRNNARNAWRHLQNANALYHSGTFSIEDLAKSLGEGEAILGGVGFSYEAPAKEQRNNL